MKKLLTKGMAVLLAVGILFSMNVSAFASEPIIGGTSYNNSPEYIELLSPADYSVYYQGETIPYSFYSHDTWTYLYSRPYVILTNKKTDKKYYSEVYSVVTPDSYDYINGSINTKKIPEGKYEFSVIHFAFESRYSYELHSVSNNPLVIRDITIKKLKAPASVKATAGKRRVKVSFAKASGAQKYYIYRASSKNGTYKKVGETKTRSFIDKTVSKGKAYYYKIKSVRTQNGKVTSAYSKPVKTGKVK